MNKILSLAVLFLLISTFVHAQENISLNFGGTKQKNYYTEVPYENVSDKLIIKVTYNGKQYRFLLDTGGPDIITKALFDEVKPVGLDPATLKRVPVSDAGGRSDSLSMVILNGLAIGDVVFNEVPALVTNDPFLFDCLDIDGSIGSNMLRNSILHISSKDQKIILTDQPEKLNLSGQTSSELYVEQFQSLPIVDVKMLSNGGSGSIPMLFDTGASEFISIALNQFLLIEPHGFFTVTGKARGSSDIAAHGLEKDSTKYRLRVADVQVVGGSFKNVGMETSLNDGSSIGALLLNHGDVTVDYIHKKFYFNPYKPVADLLREPFPISVTLKEGKVIIGLVWDEGLKDKISVNDQVLAIDDVDLSLISPCDFLLLKKLYKGGNQATVKVKRADGKVQTVVLNKK